MQTDSPLNQRKSLFFLTNISLLNSVRSQPKLSLSGQKIWALQQLCNTRIQLANFSTRVVVLNHCQIWTYQEFCKVPWDHTCLICWLVKKSWTQSQILKDVICSWSVNIRLCHHRKLNIVHFTYKCSYLRIGAWLLVFKLVTGESYNLKSMIFEFSMTFYQSTVVSFCQSSLCCYIDKHNSLFSSTNFSHCAPLSINIVHWYIPEWLVNLR